MNIQNPRHLFQFYDVKGLTQLQSLIKDECGADLALINNGIKLSYKDTELSCNIEKKLMYPFSGDQLIDTVQDIIFKVDETWELESSQTLLESLQ